MTVSRNEEKLRVPTSRPTFLLCWVSILSAIGFMCIWSYRLIGRRNHPAPSDFSSVSAFDNLMPLKGETAVLLLVLVFASIISMRNKSWIRPRSASWIVIASLCCIAAPIVFSFGYYITIFGVALFAAIGIASFFPPASADRVPLKPSLDRRVSLGLWALVAVVYCIFSMHRHASYGSGSWDMGCMIHNFYRSSRFLNTTSTVLGDVDFLGDHFMVGIYLYAPIFWISSSAYTLLLVQCVNLASSAPAIYLIARHKQAPMSVALAVSLATAFSFGMQSAVYFDSHEITVGFGFLCWGLWAMETGRLKTASVLFVVFALFKESLGAYVLALGLLALWRGFRTSELRSSVQVSKKQWLTYGTIWIVFGALWFVAVNRVFMPELIARANAPEAHETFADFGPTVFMAIKGIFSNPLKAIAALFIPAAKVQSQLVTLGGFAWLPLASPQVLIAAAPLVVERFLSSKTTMWEMGYHYAAPLSLYAGWAVACGWPRICGFTQKNLDKLGEWFGDRASHVTAGLLLASMLLINGAGYHHPANFLRWNMSYFATGKKLDAHDAAIRFLETQGREARIAAQNRLLPHIADRPVIYRLQDWEKADWILLSVGDNAWPNPDIYPRQLVRKLGKNPAWVLVFSQNSTAIFARRSVTGLAGVQAQSVLGL